MDFYYHEECLELDTKFDTIGKMNCNLKSCPNGIISEIISAFYGVVLGECPNYYTGFICFNEIHNKVAEDYDCLGKESCEIEAELK